jgi:hypothetical protein
VYGFDRNPIAKLSLLRRNCQIASVAAGGQLVKIAKFLGLATLLMVPLLGTPAAALAQSPPVASSSPSMPESWDPKIPLPAGAVLTNSSAPKDGVVHSADFSAPGSYSDLVNFYEAELPKAGFAMGPKIAVAARKVYNRTFSKRDALDSVLVSPDAKDPSKFTVHIAWSADAAKPAAKAP